MARLGKQVYLVNFFYLYEIYFLDLDKNSIFTIPQQRTTFLLTFSSARKGLERAYN